MTYGYIRVSTEDQTVENQRFEIEHFAMQKKMKVNTYIEETISGAKEYQKRELGKLLKKLQKNDTLIASELSRLGRSLFMVIEILNICMTKGVNVITIKDGFTLCDDINSKVIAFAFGLSAEIERQLISQRTKEALARLKSEGKTLGRVKGSKNSYHKLDGMKENIVHYIEKGRSKVWIAKKLDCSYNTLYHFIKKNSPEYVETQYSH